MNTIIFYNKPSFLLQYSLHFILCVSSIQLSLLFVIREVIKLQVNVIIYLEKLSELLISPNI